MTPSTLILDAIRHHWRPVPSMPASAWATEHLVIPSGPRPGPFSLSGAEYMREVIDCGSDPTITHVCICTGSQVGKTTAIMAMVAYFVANDPSWILWVMDTREAARDFASERWMPLVEASPALEALVPRGSDRHDFAKSRQVLGGAQVVHVGANSPGKLASRPCRVVVMDEVDKYQERLKKKEANPLANAEVRMKQFALPKFICSSTPTVSDGLIWQRLHQGRIEEHAEEIRRYHVPCPGCGKFVVLVWSRDYTVLPITGREAFMVWDKEARRPDKTWDFDRVRQSARFECVACGHHIRETDKTKLIRAGRWESPKPSPASFRAYHLPSWYASTVATQFGALAEKFLRAVGSLEGPQSFILNEMAEAFEGQDSRSARVELVSPPDAPPLEDSVLLLTADHQALSPHFWVVVREHDKSGNSRLRGCYACDDWVTLERIQRAHGILDHHVCIDSRHNPDEVREQCLAHGKAVRGMSVGWTPWDGQRADWRHVDERTGQSHPWGLSRYGVPLPRPYPIRLHSLNFAGDFFWLILQRLRKGPERAGGLRWELSEFPCGLQIDGAEVVNEETYRRHLDAKLQKPRAVRRKVVFEVEKRSSKWPDHLLDCEIAQIAWATLHGRFPRVDNEVKLTEPQSEDATH